MSRFCYQLFPALSIIFNNCFCTGNGWCPTQAAFLAPQDGVYVFSYSATIISGNGTIILSLLKSNMSYQYPTETVINFSKSLTTSGEDNHFVE